MLRENFVHIDIAASYSQCYCYWQQPECRSYRQQLVVVSVIDRFICGGRNYQLLAETTNPMQRGAHAHAFLFIYLFSINESRIIIIILTLIAVTVSCFNVCVSVQPCFVQYCFFSTSFGTFGPRAWFWWQHRNQVRPVIWAFIV